MTDRTTIAVRQDLKSQMDEMRASYEQKLGLPKGSLSPQVHLLSSSRLGMAFVEALEAAKDRPSPMPDPREIQENATLALEKIRSDTALLQLGVSMEEATNHISGWGALAILLMLVLGAAALASSGGAK